MSTKPNGFTLIEVAIVVGVITVLTAVALPVYSGMVERANVAAMKSDLRNLATVQESHFSDHQAYAPSASSLGSRLETSKNVTMFVDSGTTTGWGATALHSGTNTSCQIAYSSAGYRAPACNDDPIVRIVDPAAGKVVDTGDVSFVLATSGLSATSGGSGESGEPHHHLFVDRDVTPLDEPVPFGDPDIIHLRPGHTELRVPGLPHGEHRVIVLVTDEAHVPLSPPVTDTVRFSVKVR